MPRFKGLGPKCCDENRFDSVKIECDWNYFDRIHAGLAREIMERCVSQKERNITGVIG
jgi:hypothetical protein